jgi:hypothetical protein
MVDAVFAGLREKLTQGDRIKVRALEHWKSV